MPLGKGDSILSGSFARSFLIPGTKVSLLIGGQGVGNVLWYLKGAATGGALNNQGSFNEIYTDGPGGLAMLSIPLNGTPAHSRSSKWILSGKQSRFFLDARGPSPYGEVKAYLDFDFLASNANTNLNNNQGSVNGYIPRFRQGYATLGGSVPSC